MSIERLKTMKEQLMSCAESQMHNLKDVDAKELGEVVDMVKDLEEAIYYCTITEAMNKKDIEKEKETNNYYYGTNYPMSMPSPRYYTPEIYYRDIDRNNGYMYYDGNEHSMMHYDNRNYYPMTTERDPREGKSYMRRRMYMEGKEAHKDTQQQMKELEEYLQELSTDVTEMIKDASTEEKALLRQKLTTLSNKIA